MASTNEIKLSNEDILNNKFETYINQICESSGKRSLELLHDKHYKNKDLTYDKMNYIKTKIKTCKEIEYTD